MRDAKSCLASADASRHYPSRALIPKQAVIHVLNPDLFMATPALNAPEAAQELIQLSSGEEP